MKYLFIAQHKKTWAGRCQNETAQLVNDALMMAVWKRKPTKGLMVHSDRGSQYASDLYQKTIKDNGFICSMSRKGNCWDTRLLKVSLGA